ncbi:MAG: hypothetical protein CMB80_31180 [Flammeovirgaceae bacterium]|nr:hypothetical protein [Flammeovirgaceae bacterium]
MSIESVYKNILLEEYLKENLEQGNSLSAFDLIEQAEAYHEALNLSTSTRPQPLFDPESQEVARSEESSAVKMNDTFKGIIQDLKVSFIEMGNLNENSLRMFNRWQIESEAIRKELIDLEEHIENLLLITQDTEGYHSIIVDNFTDSLDTLSTATTANLDIEARTVTLTPNDESTTVQNINPPEESVGFRIRAPILFRNDMPGSQLKNVFSTDSNSVWHTTLQVSSPQTVICELSVKLADEPILVNRIEIKTLEAGQSGPVSITPLYSTDDLTYSALPTENYTSEIRDVGSFFFPATSIKYMKFVIAKAGPDPSTSINSYAYQFGFRYIKFFEESFDAGDDFSPQVLESNWLRIIGTDGETKPFEKAVLQTCEMIPEDTVINYYVAASNDSTQTENIDWHKITPLDRETEETAEKIFDIGQVTQMKFDGITIHDNDEVVNYLYIDGFGSLASEASTFVTQGNHYVLQNTTTDGFLNYLLYNEGSTKVDINDPSLIVWRNVGIESDDKSGWRFEDPYWYTIIKNIDSVEIEIDNSIIEIGTNGIFVLKENSPATIPKGVIDIRVHKDYYDSIREEIQNNVDFYAEKKLERVSIFDMLNNISDTNYNKYALDMSLPGDSPDTAKRIFIVKKNPDNASEKFKIEFNQINQLRDYIKLKAELSTSNSTLTPCITGYQLKLG